MSLETNLTIDYLDDYDPEKGYYRVLYKPGVAVQTRELNQLQSILQNQIEKFGDNVFKRGTIIDGCNIIEHPNMPYVKIKDTTTDGLPVNVTEYQNLFVKNSSNVNALVATVIPGYESRSPDLNTLYLKYNNSGSDGNTPYFSADDVLSVYDQNYKIFKARVTDGSSGFANTDSVVLTSAIAIQNSSGGITFPVGAFNVNDVIQNGVANATIVGVDSTSNTEALILKIKPLSGDLQTANTIKWRFSNTDTIRNANTANTASIVGLIGSGATATLQTDGLGKILTISVTNGGSGYYVAPHVSVSITSGGATTTTELNQLDVTAQNYLTNITVGNSAVASVGSGYGVTVEEGTIYQKGFFISVDNQLTVVNKYSNTNFTKSVGFYTAEDIVNSNQDTSLLDPAGGSNFGGPGADRLHLVPSLTVLNKSDADANSSFLPIIEYADGLPYKQNKQTVYNIIGDELAKRTYEESGDYVIDEFHVTTKDSTTFSESADIFKVAIDPGKAYIHGYRVESVTNYTANVAKGLDTVLNSNAKLRIGYGNYLFVKEFAGTFRFNYGDIVDLYDTATGYITSGATSITPAGTKIGTARVRSLLHDSGEPGSASCQYRLYLFDISMNSGKSFASCKAIYYNQAPYKGICDIVLDQYGQASLNDSKDTALLFKSADAIKNAKNVTYTYRTMDTSQSANSTGYLKLAPPGGSESFPYATGNLSSIAKRDFIIYSLGNYQAAANATGTITTSATSNVVTGSGGMNFLNNFKSGEFIKLANSTASVVKQISQVTNATSIQLTANAGSTITGNACLYLPNNIPISFTSKDTRVITQEANGQLTFAFGHGVANATSGAATSANVAVVYNVTTTNVTPTPKGIKREVYARLRLANNAGGIAGPWALGISDVFRLRGVYKAPGGSNTTISFNSNTSVNSTSDFISFTSNPFANGDYVVYTGTTPVTGLTSGSNYYVVGSNSTALSLSATRGGSAINITAISASETHSLSGPTLYFGPDTTGVTDVTRSFYVDSNQKEDYLDTSYLYQHPRQTALTANDVLLVHFDAFTSTTGVKTANSYSVNDSLPLASLSNTYINTLEIPEVNGISGKYYDLRDQFDFRPVSANTIAHTADFSSNTIINPQEPTDALRFNASEQKFPLPDSDLTANVEYYVGRNDLIAVDRSGGFIVIEGTPGITDKYPQTPDNSLTLQYINIPAYPSIPQMISANTREIADTKVINEKANIRTSKYSVTSQLSTSDINGIQIKNYTMKDLNSIEERVKSLEYYVSFTMAETMAKTRFIPSGDGLTDRFKFGFFVDPMVSYDYSDLSNPEYYSTITGGNLQPKTKDLNVEFMSEDGGDLRLIVPTFEEYVLISQNDSTNGPISNTSNTSSNTSSNTVTQKTSTVLQNSTNAYQSDAGDVYETFEYVFSSISGPVSIFMNSEDFKSGIEISQATTKDGAYQSVITSTAGQPWGASPYTDGTSKDLGVTTLGFSILGTIPNTSAYFIRGQYKVQWTHNPANGQYVRIRVYKGSPANGVWARDVLHPKLRFSYKLVFPTDANTNIILSDRNSTRFTYNGIVSMIYPAYFQPHSVVGHTELAANRGGRSSWRGADIFAPSSTYASTGSQKFTITVCNLKPNTKHKFIFAGSDKSSECRYAGDSENFFFDNKGLITDRNGVLSFDFYYKEDTYTTSWNPAFLGISYSGFGPITASNYSPPSQAIADVYLAPGLGFGFDGPVDINWNTTINMGTKVFTVTSIDGTSQATGSIEIKF